MSVVLGDRLNVEKHGSWITLTDTRGVVHLAWKWNSGSSLGYLCCTEPEWLDTVELPTPDATSRDPHVTCMACLGATV